MLTELFPLRRPDVCFRVEIAIGEAHRKSRHVGLISGCYFFATPTRLAAGLGTKDYPRVICVTLRPVLAFLRLNLVPPRCP